MTDAKPVHRDGVDQFLGIEPLSTEAGLVVIRLQPRSVHLNHNGTVNAPILYALAEVAGAGSVVAGMLEEAASSYTVVKKATIEYLASARGEVTADGLLPSHVSEEVLADVSAGRPSDVDVRDAEGALVATACEPYVRERFIAALGERSG